MTLPPLRGPSTLAHVHPLRSVAGDLQPPQPSSSIRVDHYLDAWGSFTVFPYLSPYLVSNVGFTESQLPYVYVAGGLFTLVASPLVGRWADRWGKLRVYRLVAPLSAVMILLITHLPPVPIVIAVLLFGGLMVCNVGRMIPPWRWSPAVWSLHDAVRF